MQEVWRTSPVVRTAAARSDSSLAEAMVSSDAQLVPVTRTEGYGASMPATLVQARIRKTPLSRPRSDAVRLAGDLASNSIARPV